MITEETSPALGIFAVSVALKTPKPKKGAVILLPPCGQIPVDCQQYVTRR